MGTVFSGLSALVIEDVEDAGEVIVVRARTRNEPAACPGCGTQTSRVHDYHERKPADVPVDGRRVLVKAGARRMRCPVLGCNVQTFREQVPGVLERYQRRTTRLAGQVSAAVSTSRPLPLRSRSRTNGRTEGVNCKTKMLKRQMFGRAGFELLRHRILLG